MFLIAPVESDDVSDDRQAHSLIANVAGKVFLLQKERPVAERANKKVSGQNI